MLWIILTILARASGWPALTGLADEAFDAIELRARSEVRATMRSLLTHFEQGQREHREPLRAALFGHVPSHWGVVDLATMGR
jgi:hypothetical protein